MTVTVSDVDNHLHANVWINPSEEESLMGYLELADEALTAEVSR